MKMTTRGRYGLRAVLDLARHYDGPPVLASTLAGREGISVKYLQALLATLKAGNIVQGVRGVGGGFRLARPPEQISLREVLEAVEGPLSLVDCVAHSKACSRAADCAARHVWQGLSETIASTLNGINLRQLLVAPPEKSKSKPARSAQCAKNTCRSATKAAMKLQTRTPTSRRKES